MYIVKLFFDREAHVPVHGTPRFGYRFTSNKGDAAAMSKLLQLLSQPCSSSSSVIVFRYFGTLLQKMKLCVS